jgi:hypothetical protein
VRELPVALLAAVILAAALRPAPSRIARPQPGLQTSTPASAEAEPRCPG